MKYIGYVREHFKDPKSPVVTLQELNIVLGIKGISPAYLKRLVNYMTKKKELKRITKGIYTMHDDITVVGFAFRPFYYGLENALTIRKLWEQAVNPVVITPRNVRQGTRSFEGSNYRLFRIKKGLFFGYDQVRYYNFWIPVSDYEKTLIDFVYFDHKLRDDVLAELKKKIDTRKLRSYLKLCGPSLRKKTLSTLK